MGFRFTQNIGRLIENLVFLELKRRQTFYPEIELYYWKDVHHREVDFVVKEGLKVKEFIQACWDIQNEKTKNREIRSLLKVMKTSGKEQATVITQDYEATEQIKEKKIRFLPLWRWLLDFN